MRQATEPSEDRVLDRGEMARIQEAMESRKRGPKGCLATDSIEKEAGMRLQIAGSVKAVDAGLRSQGLWPEGHGQGRLGGRNETNDAGARVG
jgi:hypothetical protein